MNSAEKPISIRDIAQMAGVSTATVSRVINNNGRFSEETRKRVQQIIDETGYVTNAAAKSLREQRSRTIGMIVPDISNDFFSNLALHTEQYLAGQGYSVFVCNSANSVERETAYIRTLTSKRVDGILCLSGALELQRDATTRNVPIVCVDRMSREDSEIPAVISDEMRGGALAAEHLVAQGCRRILCISRSTADYCGRTRETGFFGALEAQGLTCPDDYRIVLPTRKASRLEAEELVGGFIQSGRPFDGVFALSDHAAAGALRALQTHGISIPEQVKVVGYDDSVYSRLATPQITTIRRFPQQLAQCGCNVLLKLIEGQEAPHRTIVPVELVVRASTVAG